MTSRELFTNTLLHQPVERLPRDLWGVPYIDMFRKSEKDRLLVMYPMDLTGPSSFRYGASPYSKGTHNKIGRYTDVYGVTWEVLEDGIVGEVKDPIIKTKADLNNYRLPWEILDNAVDDGQSEAYKNTDLFVLAGTMVHLFEILQFLRGPEQLFCDIAVEDPIFLELLERFHEFNLKDMKMISSLAADGVAFNDDWGTQIALLISPKVWRKHFKPLYKEYCDIIHKAGKFAFFHSDGHIEAIMDDLIEIGVDALNSQLFCMDIEKVGEKYAGKIAFWGELDRQWILPFGAEGDVRAGVRRLEKALLGKKRSGLIAQLSWETLTPFDNVVAAYDEYGKL